MANIKWCESPNALDCLADGEWDLMVAYIKHSSVTDFTIYEIEGTCADTGQAFLFSASGTTSLMYGGADAADDLKITANSSDTFPFIDLLGGKGIEFEVAADEEILFIQAGGQFIKFDHSTNESFIYGGASTGDEIYIYANSLDSEPYLLLEGDDFALLNVASYVEFQDQGEQMFKFEHATPTSYMYGSDDTGDDLIILANEQDDCSSISLFGDAGIKFEIKATSIFEVATCTDETLFEIDSAAGNHHMHFHCLDACDFVLENRTDDPGSPCVGQIWFRTDLV